MNRMLEVSGMRVPLACLVVLLASLAPAAPAPAAASHDGTPPALRHTELILAPPPAGLALAEVRFPGRAPGHSVLHGSVTVSVQGAFGADYMALAANLSAGPQAMVLLANRASALLDPARVHLQLGTLPALGRPVLRSVEDPLSGAPPVSARELCDLPAAGRELGANAFRSLQARGSAPGVSPSWAVAEAYDLLCSLPHSSAFPALLWAAVPQCAPISGALCCPPTAMCAPAPSPPAPPPPVPSRPGCTPCDPPPGSACPLVLSPNVCFAPARAAGTRAAAAAH